MDWDRIEQQVYYQTQQVVSVSTVGGTTIRPPQDAYFDAENKPSNVNMGGGNTSFNIPTDPKNFMEELSALESYLNDLRNANMLQGKKVMKIENVLTNYSEVLESTTSSQQSLNERIDHVESGLRNHTRATTEASNDRSTLNIQIKTIAGKLDSLEQYLQQNEMCYATKESFAQLLDSTVDEIKSVGAVVSSASAKSSQSMSLVEALIQAIHRLKRSPAQEPSGSGSGTKTGASFTDEEGSEFGPSLEFLSMLSGNRHREQVVRLLLEALHNSMTSVAREVMIKEAGLLNDTVGPTLLDTYSTLVFDPSVTPLVTHPLTTPIIPLLSDEHDVAEHERRIDA